MKHRGFKIITAISLVILVAVLFWVFGYTNPTSAGPAGILAVFAIIYLFSLVLILNLMHFIEWIWVRIRPAKDLENNHVSSKNSKKVHSRNIYIAVALSFVPLFLISLNSIGALSVRDVLLVVAIEVLAVFYIVKRF